MAQSGDQFIIIRGPQQPSGGGLLWLLVIGLLVLAALALIGYVASDGRTLIKSRVVGRAARTNAQRN